MHRAVAPVCRSFGGIATRRQILGRGVDGGDIASAVRRGEIRRVRRAHYASPDASVDGILAVRVGGRLCGLSAAGSHGLWSGHGDELHIAVPPHASRLRTVGVGDARRPDIADRRIIVHWIPTAPHRECWRVGLGDALRQVAAWADRETAIACLDSAVGAGMPLSALRRELEDADALARVRSLAVREGSQSGLESIVRQRLGALGLAPRQQVAIAGVGRVDMVVGRLVIEVDGAGFHRGPAAFDEDRRRDAELVARGYAVIRLSYDRIVTDWAWCASRVVAALAQHSGDPAGETGPPVPMRDIRHTRTVGS